MTTTTQQWAKEALAKAEEAKREATEELQRAELRVSEFKTIIEHSDVYFLSDNNKYAIRDIDCKGNVVWTFITEQAAAKLFCLLNSQDKKIFDGVLRELQRIKLRSVCTFNEPPVGVLNLMSQEGWIEVDEGQYDPIFDVLLNSLSAGRQVVREHLEKVLVYKYLHPETYKLPCITISGEGGVGKNDFVEQVLSTIFGKQQIAVIGSEEAFGPYNGQMLGKTVVFIDEALADKTNAESLKRKVGNETIQINMKYGIQGTFDNTPWYWLGGNGTNGAVMLAGDMTDRRYSVISVKNSLMFWVGKILGIEVSGKSVLPDSHPTVQWYNEHFRALSDRGEVAKWLGSIVVKWHNQVSPPGALHDDDYRNILHQQTNVIDDLCDEVFGDVGFTHIELSALYSLYKITMKDDNPSARMKGKRNFLEDVKRIVERRYPDVQYLRLNIKDGGKRTSGWCFIDQGKVGATSIVVRNTEGYVVSTTRGLSERVQRESP